MENAMKSERRHELQENDLSERAGTSFRSSAPVRDADSFRCDRWPYPRFTRAFRVSARWEATRSESWDTCLAALVTGDPEGFREVILRYPDTPAAQWAELILADRTLV